MKRFLWIFFTFVFFTLCLFSSGTIESQDGQQYLAIARNLYYLHEPVAPPYEYPEKNIHMNVMISAKDGKYYSPTGLGYSLAMLPAVAASDALHQLYDVAPPQHFPLESDWAVMLFASFTNAFFGAVLAVFIYLWLREYKHRHTTSMAVSLLGIFATNLLPYTKHAFAHMMFTCFLVGTFYFLKRASNTKKALPLIMAGICFGILALSYSPVFAITVPAIVLYFFALFPLLRSRGHVVTRFRRGFAVALGALPFICLYLFYNYVRIGSPLNSGYGLPTLSFPQTSLLTATFEGMWGYLFSPGRSFFLYSPILILPLIYWQNLQPKQRKGEWLALVTLIAIFFLFHASRRGGHDWLAWSGESSWGPRYLLPTIPFFLVFVAEAIQSMTRTAKRFVLLPLALFSVFIQILGTFLPYEIKFDGVPYQTYIGDHRLTTWDYGNFLPRFSPILRQTKSLVKQAIHLPGTLSHGPYKVVLKDGFDIPFKPGNGEIWRGMHETSLLQLDHTTKRPVREIELRISNQTPSTESSYLAETTIRLNGQQIATKQTKPDEVVPVTISPADQLHEGYNTLALETRFVGTQSATQQAYLRSLEVNGENIPLTSLDYPYAQPLAQKMTGKPYTFWGNQENNNWKLWFMRSGVYRTTFDFWWLKYLYYWDLPGSIYLPLFFITLGGTAISGYLLWTGRKQPGDVE